MEKQRGQQFQKKIDRLRWLVVLFFGCLLIGNFFSSCSKTSEKQETVTPTMPSSTEIVQNMSNDMQGLDFSTFKHDSQQHGRLTCLLCHERNDDSTKPKFARHVVCSSCHVQQFEDKSNPMCGICHTNNETGEMKPFPPRKSFLVQFNHQAHFKETNCAGCHKNENAGGMSIPSGPGGHETCFQCHTPDKIIGEKNLGSCSTCHQLGTPNRFNDSVKNIGFKFSHAGHNGVSCQSCHNPTSGNQMSAISVAMHKDSTNSCATCHNNQKAFGGNNLSDCRRCHQEAAGGNSFGVRFNHSSHAKTNCSTCHQGVGGGTTFSIPNGEKAHNTCFQCHSPTKDGKNFATSKCFQCHETGNPNDIPATTGVISSKFSHFKHKNLSCNSCHNATKGGVSAPTIAMHKAPKGIQSCATCHNNKRTFGGEDFSNCKRCHTGGNFNF